MRADIQKKIDDISESLDTIKGRLNYEEALLRLEELTALILDVNLWDDPQRAQKLTTEKNVLQDHIDFVQNLSQFVKDTTELAQMAEAEGNEEMINQIIFDLEKEKEVVSEKELESLLSGEADSNDCFLEIHAGAGGTEAMDWASMLYRMYDFWANKHGYGVEVMDTTDGEEAGIKSITLKIKGHNAYGWLKCESGVHRLVRISPFDANARRHTSFASVWVYPVVDDTIRVEINPEDCRIDTYRASGAGGQHVNKTSSAIRITHLPTGIVVQCQNQRSQFQNKDEAWAMLRARLYEFELRKKQAQIEAVEASKSEIGWGHQIRSYVLQPYQMIKDLRTEAETSNVKAVLDGDIDLFLKEALMKGIGTNG